MKAHQKCFSLKNGDALANRFVLVANLTAKDGGKAIVAGNERVLPRPPGRRQVLLRPGPQGRRLEDRVPKLNEIIFHEKLGTPR